MKDVMIENIIEKLKREGKWNEELCKFIEEVEDRMF